MCDSDSTLSKLHHVKEAQIQWVKFRCWSYRIWTTCHSKSKMKDATVRKHITYSWATSLARELMMEVLSRKSWVCSTNPNLWCDGWHVPSSISHSKPAFPVFFTPPAFLTPDPFSPGSSSVTDGRWPWKGSRATKDGVGAYYSSLTHLFLL